MNTSRTADSTRTDYRRLALRVGTAVAVAIVVVPLLAFLWLLTAMHGGLDDVLSLPGPKPTDRRVEAALRQAEKPIDQEAAGLTSLVVASTPDLRARPLARGELPPRCTVGVHDWKRDDPYDLICSKERVELIVITPRSSLEADMLALDEALRADGWWPTYQGLADSVLERRQRRAAAQDGSAHPPAEFPRPANYDRFVEEYGPDTTLDIGWVSRRSESVRVAYSDDLVLMDATGRPRSVDRVLHDIPRGGYAVVLRLTVDYFRA